VQTYQPDRWSALGDRTRRAIFERLADRPCAVGELAKGLPVSRPAVSQHLKILKDAGLVMDQPAGNRRIYRINPDGLAELRAELDRLHRTATALSILWPSLPARQPGGGRRARHTHFATGFRATGLDEAQMAG
jgi:DNA-binding transcriptional ArsR family regulator